MTKTTMIVATAQAAGSANIDDNIAKVERLAGEAASLGAELVVFPEAMMFDYTATAEQMAEAAQSHGDMFEKAMLRIAKENNIALVVGAYAAGKTKLAKNMMLAIDANGEWLGQYQKLHLYDAFLYQESSKNEPAPLQPDFGELVSFTLGGFKFGLLNCYDIRFPEISRLLVEQGADALLVSSGWVAGPLKEFHWETLLKARAIENTCYVVGSCQPAPLSVGLSMAVDPNGVAVSVVPAGEGLAIATLDQARIKAVRDVLPCLEHRRYRICQPVGV
ncbi:putative amidohydrolase [Paenochrobactrum gallinarii]|uniref:Putative amidohydrolase n=1 Tax=Paenochrobactrum gallinarii TaxID=643673 RepID=A0A841LWL3_9HYPH|nr:carbon-nitrogen hydrolase family protein [Paenochrobactrum gallinarii]MBB6260039.1 putative amidohydrolase [Paenochrobactrum gallinarii]